MRKRRQNIIRMIALLCVIALFGTVVYSAVAGILGYF